MPFAKDQYLIQAFPVERPDEPFDIWILPRGSRCSRAVPNSQ
jgi:hypothetical protein